MAWTEQQSEAITTRDCGLIVSAAAGSGKTSVLVERLLRILEDETPEHRVPADRMIVVTFTNDAAAEMRSRLYQALDDQLQKQPENQWLYQQQVRLQNAHICTISSFCFDLIRDNLTEQGITAGFRILNETEAKLIASKAADTVLNRWHAERQEEMQLLWNCFCEKNDKPLEELLLELHSFLGSVPFREQWTKQVLEELNQPLSDSAYHRAFLAQLEQRAETAVRLANEAADLAAVVYDSVPDNNVLPWVETDVRCLEKVLQMLRQQEPDAEKILAPIQEKNQNRGNFPRKKKAMTDLEAFERVKKLREQYTALEKEIAALLEAVYPYEAGDLVQHAQLMPLLLELEEQLTAEIWQQKVQQNALAFDDAERMALELLAELSPEGTIQPSALAKELQAYYQLIMIDEYQDSNNKQDDIFKLLSRNCIEPETGTLRYGDNVFLVGDVKQSIYRFRLANPQNFVHAISSAGTETSVCRHIVLNRNFRSVPVVLDFVNFVCGSLMSDTCGDVAYTDAEALYPGTDITEILPEEQQKVTVAVLTPEDDADTDVQIAYVIGKIQEMIVAGVPVAQKDHTTRPCQYRDFCILLRTNPMCTSFAHALEQAGIPVQSPDETGYLKAREVGLLLDMLRVLDNPTLDTSLAAIMLSPMFWFTPEDLMRIRMLGKKTSLYSAVCMAIGVTESAEPVQLDDVLVQKCRQLYDTLQKLRQSSGMMTLEALIRRIYDTTDFLSVMQLTKDGDRKRANLHLLLQYAKQYEENTDAAHNGVSGFLRYIDWLLDSGNDFQQTSLTAGVENAVAVKTMHRSKGLEYPFVFLGKLESPFSTEDSRKNAVFSEKGLVGFCIKNPENYTRAKTMPFAVLEQENRNASRSEELRLLYVAMTRAKQQLFLPLNLKKVRIRTTDYLAQYSTLILPDGTLPPLTVQNAGSMAHWVWMCLVLRHDAVLAREINLPPQCWNTPAWSEKLQIHYEFSLPPVTKSDTLPEQAVIQPDADTLKDLKKITAFQYTSPDCGRQSLLSVSALQEAHQKRAPVWKRPDFRLQEGHLTGAERGTAIHTFFQYADFRKAQADVPAEIQRLQTYGFLTPEQAAAVKPEIPAAFFRDDLYRRLCRSKRVLREQKFLVQCRDLSAYPETAAILRRYENSDSILKGIIDLAFQEGDCFVLVDYKTDTVSSPDVLVDSYREQLMLYCGALQCITGMPVKECYLYSTHFQKSIEVKP